MIHLHLREKWACSAGTEYMAVDQLEQHGDVGQRRDPFALIKSHMWLQLVKWILVDMVTLKKEHLCLGLLEYTFDQFVEHTRNSTVLLLGKHLVIVQYFYGYLPGTNISSNWR